MNYYTLKLLTILCCFSFFVKAQNAVNFSTAEGFTNGSTLTSQTNWSASSWIVDTDNGGMVATSTDWKRRLGHREHLERSSLSHPCYCRWRYYKPCFGGHRHSPLGSALLTGWTSSLETCWGS